VAASAPWVVVPLLVLLGAAGGIWLGGHPWVLPGPVRAALVGHSGEFRSLDQALDFIESDYYRPVSRDRLVDRSLDAAVAGLRDQYSRYLTPRDYRAFNDPLHGRRFVGVGIQVSAAPKGLLVREVYEDAPAARAGLRPGDVIVAADGRRLAKRPVAGATDLITGPEGTRVRLTWLRDGRRISREVAREEVAVPNVQSELATAPNGEKVAEVSLAQFVEGAHGLVRQAIDRRLAQGAKAVVLDLRNNPGGLLQEAVLTASIFIPEGPVVSTDGRNRPRKTYTAVGGAISGRIPVVVLVDEQTASAAEIVTGALQDRRRGEVVGTRTYGKGVFQEVRELPNGGAIDITVGEYFLPSGRNLGGPGVERGGGVHPDVQASDDPATLRDEALQAALRVVAGERR
jgi:carboxyl-terminal processing protease